MYADSLSFSSSAAVTTVTLARSPTAASSSLTPSGAATRQMHTTSRAPRSNRYSIDATRVWPVASIGSTTKHWRPERSSGRASRWRREFLNTVMFLFVSFWAFLPGDFRGSVPDLPVIYEARHSVADELQSLDEDHDDHDGHEHHVTRKAGVAVVHGQLSQPAAAHGASHNRVRHERHDGYGQSADERGQRFAHEGPTQLHSGRALDAHRVDRPGTHFAQGLFDEAGIKRDRANRQWQGRSLPADRCSHHEAGEGNDRDHQN